MYRPAPSLLHFTHITSITKEQNVWVFSGDIWHRLNGIFNPRYVSSDTRTQKKGVIYAHGLGLDWSRVTLCSSMLFYNVCQILNVACGCILINTLLLFDNFHFLLIASRLSSGNPVISIERTYIASLYHNIFPRVVIIFFISVTM